MATDETSTVLVLLVAVVALIGVGLAATSFATHRDFGHMSGGMMDGDHNVTAAGPGAIEWTVLIVSIAFFAVAVALFLRGRGTGRAEAAATRVASVSMPSEADHIPGPAVVPPATEAVPEMALMRLLDGDEKRMYLEIREHGGEMYQRDLVALGTFSKAKVTRVLDRLEDKGLVVRERHGMTNRVRIVGKVAR